MRTRVLLSIKPEFSRLIFSGEKKFEYRRVIFRDERVSTVVVYSSSPVQRVVGEFRVGEILRGAPEDLWLRTGRVSGIAQSAFFRYFENCDTGYAIEVRNPKQYRLRQTLDCAFAIASPPQSFCYL